MLCTWLLAPDERDVVRVCIGVRIGVRNVSGYVSRYVSRYLSGHVPGYVSEGSRSKMLLFMNS